MIVAEFERPNNTNSLDDFQVQRIITKGYGYCTLKHLKIEATISHNYTERHEVYGQANYFKKKCCI